MNPIEAIRSAERAAIMLAHPMRPRILHAARDPISAADLARELGQPRQRVNYHVRQLAAAGFLRPVAQQRKRNMVEQRYVASAMAYVLAPEVVGEVAPVGGGLDGASAAHLVALLARAQSEISGLIEAANAAGLRLRTLAMNADLRFENSEQRADFTKALISAVSGVVARHSWTDTTSKGAAATGRPFRLVLGCYPASEQVAPPHPISERR